jgi:hypothetical protein
MFTGIIYHTVAMISLLMDYASTRDRGRIGFSVQIMLKLCTLPNCYFYKDMSSI